jgi:uncharacterized OsmC-like protein
MAVTTTTRNGVDVQKLTALIDEVKREPWKGNFTFSVKSEWKGGFRSQHTVSDYVVGDEPRTHVKGHSVQTDEPTALLGADSGISPTEMILSALASCLSVGYAANAAALGIDLKEVRLEITGHGDLQGFMGLNDARPGLSDVKVKAFVKSDAPPEKLQELHDYVNAHSPIWDTISRPVSVTSQLKIE